MKKIFLMTLVAGVAAAMLSGCGIMKQVESAYNMTQCEYAYDSISDISLGDVNLSGKLSAVQIAQLGRMLVSKSSSIPMKFDVNLNVKNPNNTAASLAGMDYILSIDGVQFTSGTLRNAIEIGAGGSSILPVTMAFDLAELFSGDSSDAAVNAVKNFIGIGDKPSNVTLNVKPSINIAGRSVPIPAYIPVNFSFGGSQK